MRFSRKTLAYLAALLFAVIIGFSFMFIKVAIRFAGPLDILADRFSIAFLFALIPLLSGRIKLSIRPRDVLRILPIALFNPFLYFFTQALGLVTLSSSEAGIIQAALPVFTLFLAEIFLKEKTGRLQKAAMMLSVFGIMFIFIMQGAQFGRINLYGVIMLLISTLSYAAYNVLARTMTRKYRMADLTYLMILIGFITFTALAFAEHLIHGTVSGYFRPLANPLFLLSVSSLGILASYTTFFLSNFALSELEAAKMSVLTNLTTLIAIFAGILFLHEKLFYYHFIGAASVLLGVLGVNAAPSPAAFTAAKQRHGRHAARK